VVSAGRTPAVSAGCSPVNRRCPSGSWRVVVRREGAALWRQRRVLRRRGQGVVRAALWRQRRVLRPRGPGVVRQTGAALRGSWRVVIWQEGAVLWCQRGVLQRRRRGVVR
jgi:hypothetical protein